MGQESSVVTGVLLNHAGAPLAIVVTVLCFVVLYGHRQCFSGILVQRT